MAILRKFNFSSGELDPALHERTNLDKYQNGLMTARNVIIGKTGRIINRPGGLFIDRPKYDNRECVIISPPYEPYLIEWGHQYVRIHDIIYSDTGVPVISSYEETAHDWTEDDLPNLQFEFGGRFMYVFCEGKVYKKMVVGPLDMTNQFLDARFQTLSEIIFSYPAKTAAAIVANTPTALPNYLVDYVITYVMNGEESIPSLPITTMRMPITNGEYNIVRLYWAVAGTAGPYPTEIRIYRRPQNSGALGYIGSSTAYYTAGGFIQFDFMDFGIPADYSNSPAMMEGFLSISPKAGIVYQQRLVLGDGTEKETIRASRPGYPNNFTRSYPFSSDSALMFKSGTSGNARVLRFMDNNGLHAFTTIGLYANDPGALTVENIAMSSKGNWVIDERVPPLKIPGGVLFVDRTTNTIRSLIFSNEAGGYPGEEASIFSNHLFINKRVVSWAYQDGDIPLIWVVMSDGSLLSLTYQREHQMSAWTRHDSGDGKFESVTVVKDLNAKSGVFFVVKRGNIRTIECLSDRFVDDLDVKKYCIMDSAATWDFTLNDSKATTDLSLTPVVPGNWSGQLTLTAVGPNPVFNNTADDGAPGTTWRYFDKDGYPYDLTVVTRTNDHVVVVQPSEEFPSDEATGITLQRLATTLGLTPGFAYGKLAHLEGQLVTVVVDGNIISSPNNDIENYDPIVVTGGAVTLPDGLKGAFIRIGIPFTSDVETLDVDTVEQKPTLLESKIVGKVFVKVHQTRGIYVGSKFPEDDRLTDEEDSGYQMTDPEELDDSNFIGNMAPPLFSKRYEVVIQNDWDSSGRICIRQVDPYPFEILSIIPELTIPT